MAKLYRRKAKYRRKTFKRNIYSGIMRATAESTYSIFGLANQTKYSLSPSGQLYRIGIGDILYNSQAFISFKNSYQMVRVKSIKITVAIRQSDAAMNYIFGSSNDDGADVLYLTIWDTPVGTPNVICNDYKLAIPPRCNSRLTKTFYFTKSVPSTDSIGLGQWISCQSAAQTTGILAIDNVGGTQGMKIRATGGPYSIFEMLLEMRIEFKKQLV